MSDNTNNGFPVPEEPLTREEQYLSAIAGVTASTEIPEKPLTRVEAYLNKIVENGGGGGGFEPTDEQLAAMNSGATTAKIDQIETNKNNISSLMPLAFIAPTLSTDATNANLTIIYGGYYKVGKLTIVNIKFTIESTIEKSHWIFEGLPKSEGTSSLNNGASLTPCHIIPITNGNETLCALCKKDGTTTGIAVTSTGVDMTAGTYLFSGFYLSE